MFYRRRILALILILAAIRLASANPEDDKFNIILKPASVDFGTFRTRDFSATNGVTLRNLGNTDILVSSIHTGCGCIRATLLGDRRIEPNGDRQIQLDLETHGASVGPAIYRLTVFSGTPPVPVAQGDIRYAYLPDVEISPGSLCILGDTSTLHSASGTGSACVRLIDHWLKPLSVESVSFSHPLMEHAIVDTTYQATNRRRTHQIRVYAVLPPGWPIGSIDETMTITTNHPDHTSIVVPIKGTVSGPIRTTPGIIMVRNLQLGDSFERTVTLDADSPIVISDWLCTSPTMAVQILDGPNANTVQVRCSDILSAQNIDSEMGTYYHAVTLHIIDPMQYTQTIKVLGLFKRGSPSVTPQNATLKGAENPDETRTHRLGANSD